MSMAQAHLPSSGTHIAVWMANEVPARVVYRGTRYRVTDMPTRLEDAMFMMTHPLPLTGWRFEATDSHGQSLMFDIRRDGDGWALIRAYD